MLYLVKHEKVYFFKRDEYLSYLHRKSYLKSMAEFGAYVVGSNANVKFVSIS